MNPTLENIIAIVNSGLLKLIMFYLCSHIQFGSICEKKYHDKLR